MNNAIMCAIENEQRKPLERGRGGFYWEDIALLPGIKVMSMGFRH